MNRVLRHLRRAALLSAGDALTDSQLLEAFLSHRDEAAFEVLLRRHGPMVLGVCRRVLRNCHDAEDAFQATFLVLARKAGSVRSLSSWLYGVAYRTAMKARAMSAKRRTKEMQAWEQPPAQAAGEGVPEELLAQLDAELNRLPERYRVPVILCELEGKSRREVARILGLPEGTLSWRLAYAKKLLARKLARYGFALAGGAQATLLSEGTAEAVPTPSLLTATAKVAAGQVVTAGAVPAQVLALAEGVMKAMLLTKLKVAAWVVLLAVCVGGGAAYRAVAQAPYAPQAYVRVAPDDLEALRLEIEALRKEMRAMRERMKALEAKVEGQERDRNRQKAADEVRELHRRQLDLANQERMRYLKQVQALEAERAERAQKERAESIAQRERRTKLADDAGAQAEVALKKLLQNSNDKQAAEALEQALKRLKELGAPQPAKK